jgi:predicted ribosomally synthesized peptide with SipW-like signal peptide
MKINKRILVSIAIIALMGSVIGGGTIAYFSDVETSNGNTFTAGTLDLQIDGGDANVVKFTVNNFRPGNQPKQSFVLDNVGSLNGYLDLEAIAVTDYENGRNDPEIDAGDTTDGVGELSSVVNLRLFVDYGGDGWISTGDNVFFNGLVNTLPSSFELNEPISAGGTLYIVALFDWWSTPNDNLAQSDSMVIDIGFELGQTAGQ